MRNSSNIRTYVISFLVFVVLSFVLFGFVVNVFCAGWSPKDSWMPNVYWAKCMIASQTKSPKVVVMGGSASTFGIDGSIIKKESGMPVVNMALHAGLPLRTYLSMVDRYVEHGDVVVLPLELCHYGDASSKIYSDLSLSYFLGIAPEFQRTLTIGQFGELYLRYGLSWLNRCLSATDDCRFRPEDMECAYLRGQLIRVRGEESSHREYGLPHLDEYGDTIMPFGQKRPIPTGQCANRISDEFLEVYRALRVAVEQKGATMFLTYPTMFRCEDDATLPHFIARLSSMGVTVLGDPYLMSFPASYHYDTDRHLNAYGARIYTSVLAKIICRHLKPEIPEKLPDYQIPLKAICDGTPVEVKKPLAFSSRRWCCYITLERNGQSGKVCRKVLVNGAGSAFSEVEYSVKNVVKVLLPRNHNVVKIVLVPESGCVPAMERILLECPDLVPVASERARTAKK